MFNVTFSIIIFNFGLQTGYKYFFWLGWVTTTQSFPAGGESTVAIDTDDWAGVTTTQLFPAGGESTVAIDTYDWAGGTTTQSFPAGGRKR